MLKFRKMHHNASGPPLTTADDERFTRIGRFLARAKLDELPQLWHVLKRRDEPDRAAPRGSPLRGRAPADYDEILRVRPGVTGLSQIAFAEESAILSKDDPISHYRERSSRRRSGSTACTPPVRRCAWTSRSSSGRRAAVLLRRQVAVHRETGRMNLRRR